MSDGFGGREQNELRRLLALSFSPSELAELAAELELPTDGDVAREIVRRAPPERLVARLRELRPLVEWPAPPAPRPGATTVIAEPSPAALAPAEAPPQPAPGPRPIDEPTLVSARPGPPAGEAEAPPPDPPGALPARPPLPPIRPAAPAEPAKSKIDPRLLAAVGGLTLIGGLIAFVAGRSARQAEAGPRVSIRKDGPSDRVRARFEKSLLQVARDCEVVGSQLNEPSVFDRALERCGKDFARPKPTPEPPKPERSVLDLPPEPSASADAPPEPSATAAAPRATAPRDPQAPRAPAAPKAPKAPVDPDRGCVSRCESGHRTCKSACGAEPQQGSQFQAYQACLGRCLSSVSQCRLGCAK